jgi:hypothetical protein
MTTEPALPEEKQVEGKASSQRVTLSGRELIILIVFSPVVFTWLFLAARIIVSATTSPNVLENIEGLLTALAILTVPVSGGIGKLFEGWGNKPEQD